MIRSVDIGGQTYSVGQGVGVKSVGRNGTISYIHQEKRGEYSLRLEMQRGGSMHLMAELVGPWMAEEEIEEAIRVYEAEGRAGAADLYSVLFGDTDRLIRQLREGIGVLEEAFKRPKPIGEVAVVLGIGIQTIEDAVREFGPASVAEAVRDYAERLRKELAQSPDPITEGNHPGSAGSAR